LIDVRTPAEFQEVHIDFARNVPLDQLQAGPLLAGGTREALYVICRSGSRGKQACSKLETAGIEVVNVEGGTVAWEALP
jgi:rhodanese-related sulfurtransferase